MKHISYIVLLASLFAVSCVDEGDTLQPSGAADGIGFVGTMDSGDESRTSYEQGDESVKVMWAANDRIGIFSEMEGSVKDSNFGYQAVEAAASTSFRNISGSEVVEWADETTPHDFYAYYPYDKSVTDLHAVPVSVASEQTYDENDLLGFLSESDFMYASSLGHTKAEVGEGNPLQLAFRHLFSILRVRLRASQFVGVDAIKFRCTDESEALSLDSGATVDLATGEIDMTSATTANEIAVVGHRELTMNDYADYYMLVTPGHAGKTFEFVAVIGDTERVFATRTVGESGLSAGKTIIVEADLEVSDEEASPVTDLSAAGTANTYYVSQPGTIYKFKATVKGNGEAYTSDNLSYTAEDLVIAPKNALVLWYTCLQTVKTPANQQSPVVINSVTLGDDGYIYFQTPSEFVPGNVSIVAIDEDLDYAGIEVDPTYHTFTNTNVLWSWNIVAVEGYDYEATAFSKGGYTFMSRNIGALIEPEAAVVDGKVNNVLLYQALGNYYQYGRKDPFPTLMEYIYLPSIYNPLWFTPTYTPVPALDYGNVNNSGIYNQIFGRSRETIGVFFEEMIGTEYTGQELMAYLDSKAPHRWALKSSDLYQWHYLPASFVGDVWSDDESFSMKTIYDPCPAGWRVMTHNAWTALTSDAVTEFDYTTGQVVKIDGHSFLAYSYRNYGGSPDSTAVYGNDAAEIRYHLPSSTLISGSESGVGYINIGKNIVDETSGEGSREITFKTGHYITSYGYPVRCVKIQ